MDYWALPFTSVGPAAAVVALVGLIPEGLTRGLEVYQRYKVDGRLQREVAILAGIPEGSAGHTATLAQVEATVRQYQQEKEVDPDLDREDRYDSMWRAAVGGAALCFIASFWVPAAIRPTCLSMAATLIALTYFSHLRILVPKSIAKRCLRKECSRRRRHACKIIRASRRGRHYLFQHQVGWSKACWGESTMAVVTPRGPREGPPR